MRVKFKITLAFVVLAVLLLLSSCLFAYLNAKNQQQRDFAKMLQNKALTMSSLLFTNKKINYNILSKVDSASKNLLFAENINVFNSKNQRIYHFIEKANDTVIVPLDLVEKARVQNKVLTQISSKPTIAMYFNKNNYPFVITVSASDDNGEIKLASLKWNLMYSFLVGSILSLLFGYVFSNVILKPLVNISNRVNKISASNFEERLPVNNLKDEWSKLAKTFNDLLTRLRESFELQGRFIANASHELSTPLTSVSNQIDVVLRKDRTKDEYLQVLRSVKSDVQHMSELTQQLLEIARTSSGGSIQTENIRVDELLMEIPSLMKKINSNYNASIFFDELPEDEEYCLVNGNYALLLAAFKNIAENGCKYSPNHQVKISLSFIENKIVILFTNVCVAINQNEINQLFQPFQRGSNASNVKGYGLGLSLTRRIMLIHKGEIKAEISDNNTIMISVILHSMLHKQ
jgi:two-component system, OmpR family, sensor histidine kinase ArlS